MSQALDPGAVAQLLSFDPFDPGFRANPYPVYRKLNEPGPVTRSPGGLWMVWSHELCTSVLRDPRFGWGEATLSVGHFSTDPDGNTVRPLTFLDPPDHTRLRSLITKAFSVRMVERLRPRAEQLLAELVTAARAGGGPVDFMRAVAYPLPGLVLSELLGVDSEYQEQFRGWSEIMGRGLDPDFMQPAEEIQRREKARAGFHEYFGELAARRRAEPADDLVSALVAVEQQGDRLSETELVVMCTLLLSAGYATTVHLIGNGVFGLLSHPEQLAWFRAHPDQAAGVVEEVLRYDGPVQMVSRVPLQDAEIAGTPVGAGEPILLMIGAANRDPAVFGDADRLDVSRRPGRNLGFGLGIHFCLGAPLARLTAQVALSFLASNEIELAVSDPPHAESLVMRGLAELLVHLK